MLPCILQGQYTCNFHMAGQVKYFLQWQCFVEMENEKWKWYRTRLPYLQLMQPTHVYVANMHE
jgi:hypothetical protein